MNEVEQIRLLTRVGVLETMLEDILATGLFEKCRICNHIIEFRGLCKHCKAQPTSANDKSEEHFNGGKG